MKTWHIHIQGRVQGVGFRPFIYRLAKNFGLNGTVANRHNGVHIVLNAELSQKEDFITVIRQEAPKSARIVEIHTTAIEEEVFEDFSIIESSNHKKPKLLVTPDIALCSDCKQELADESNKRYNYAFTTCTQCGPRFSILEKLPYDRVGTTMNDFEMCPDCQIEYDTVTDRRFFSQTNSCPACGVELSWLKGSNSTNTDFIEQVATLIKAGKIVAVKGIGGFLLLVDATNNKAIDELRKRKKRPNKPFALLLSDLDEVEKYVRVTPKEAKLLSSAEAPIVLLTKRKDIRNIAHEEVAPGLTRLGVMLPNAPILELIAKQVNRPLVATSANITGSPIIYKDQEAVHFLGSIADAILTNNRKITFPQDDSVAVFSKHHEKQVLYRRSRGYAPSVPLKDHTLPNNMLAFGAEMKSAFSFTSKGNTYLSQFLGDTSSYESQQAFDTVFTNLMDIMQPKIEAVVVDKHPDYHTSLVGQAWAKYHDVPLIKVQHHKAHFAAALTEHQLLNAEKPILGVVWDGTGYGDDGAIWGSEFFTYANHEMTRVQHIAYYPHLFADRMAKEPAIATMAIMHPELPGKVWQRKHFSEKEQEIIPRALDRFTLKSSSMGRLFDAVAGLFGICTKNTFEGEAAMLLQVEAEKSTVTDWAPYCLPIENGQLNASYMLNKLLEEQREGKSIPELALRFHQTLVQWIAWVANMAEAEKVVFSGGVFQNTLLVDLIYERMGDVNELYFHKLLPPNDENIAIGQIAMTTIEEQPHKLESKTTKNNALCA
jgi:hydrogenase maturation protein HypF